MKKLNYYDFISFPDRAQRDEIHRNFFNFGSLRLCEKDILPQEKEVYSLSELPIRERTSRKITHFNNNMAFLDVVGLQFVHYYNLFVAEIDTDKKSYYDILFKQAYRNMCMEIFVYKEKVTNFLVFVYQIDTKGLNTKKIWDELKHELKKTEYGKALITSVNHFLADTNIKDVISYRHNETHNETSLLTSLDTQSDTNNKIYYEKIKNALAAMFEFRNAFQEFLVKCYPNIQRRPCVL